MKVIFVCVLAAGMVATVNSACTSMAAEMCDSDQIDALASAGIDLLELCTAYRIYVSCLTKAGCADHVKYSLKLKTAQKYTIASCDGQIVTSSVATILLTLIAILVK